MMKRRRRVGDDVGDGTRWGFIGKRGVGWVVRRREA